MRARSIGPGKDGESKLARECRIVGMDGIIGPTKRPEPPWDGGSGLESIRCTGGVAGLSQKKPDPQEVGRARFKKNQIRQLLADLISKKSQIRRGGGGSGGVDARGGDY